MARPTYLFGNGKSDGHAGMKPLLGLKGAHACEMASLGLPVSPGFCISSKFLHGNREESLPTSEKVQQPIKEALNGLEDMVGRKFGHPTNPLLLSVQTDSTNAVPCFQGIVENIGLNDDLVDGWTRQESPHFVWDSYRRLISTFSRAVRRLDMQPFESELAEIKRRLNARCQLGREHEDCHIPTHELRDLVDKYKEFFEEQTGEPFPQEPEKQLWETVRAASRSWENQDGDVASAVTVQSTVPGNHDFRSAVGCTFSHAVAFQGSNPQDDSAEEDCFPPAICGEWLINAQTEDMHSSRVPLQLTEDASRDWAAQKGMAETEREQEYRSLEEEMPSIFAQLLHCQNTVESHFSDVDGLDFSIGDGQLWLLRTRAKGEQIRSAASLHAKASGCMLANEVSAPQPETAKQSAVSEVHQDVQQLHMNIFTPREGGARAELGVPDHVPLFQPFLDESYDASDAADQQPLSPHAHPKEPSKVDASVAPFDLSCEELSLQVQEESCICLPDESTNADHPLSTCSDDHRKINLPFTAVRPLRHTLARQSPRLACGFMRRFRRRTHASSNASNVRASPIAKIEEETVQPQSTQYKKTLLALPLWQTGLAGGLAAVTCRSLASCIEGASSAASSAIAAKKPCLPRLQSLMTGGAFAGSARTFQMGAICCSLYVNLCNVSPADDTSNRHSPLWRLGCAGLAASSANAVVYTSEAARKCLQISSTNQPSVSAAPLKKLCRGMTPALAAVVPTMSMEMCTIDLVRNAAGRHGYDASPSVLLASGAAAGIVTQLALHPIKMLQNVPRTSTSLLPTSTEIRHHFTKEPLPKVCATLGSRCLRSMPIVACNSLVRVGLVMHFTSQSTSAP